MGKRKGALHNARRERFAQLVAQGLPAEIAYRKAGYACTKKLLRQSATRLLRDPGVAARVNQLGDLDANEGTTEAVIGSMLTVPEKRAILALIAREAHASPRERIAAVTEDSRLAGDYPTDAQRNAPEDFRDTLQGGELRISLADADAAKALAARRPAQAKHTGYYATQRGASACDTTAKAQASDSGSWRGGQAVDLSRPPDAPAAADAG